MAGIAERHGLQLTSSSRPRIMTRHIGPLPPFGELLAAGSAPTAAARQASKSRLVASARSFGQAAQARTVHFIALCTVSDGVFGDEGSQALLLSSSLWQTLHRAQSSVARARPRGARPRTSRAGHFSS
jgi:hypothetical protein